MVSNETRAGIVAAVVLLAMPPCHLRPEKRPLVARPGALRGEVSTRAAARAIRDYG
jgi:hypothetical protein